MSYWDKLPGELQNAITQRARRLQLEEQLLRLQTCWEVAIHAYQNQQSLSIRIDAEIKITDSKIFKLTRTEQGPKYEYGTWTFVDGWLDSSEIGNWGWHKQKEFTCAWSPVRDCAYIEGKPIQPAWAGMSLLGVRI